MTGSEPHRSQGSVASIDRSRTRAAEAVSSTELSQIFALMISALRNSNIIFCPSCVLRMATKLRCVRHSATLRSCGGHPPPMTGAGQIIEDQSPASVTNMQHAAVSHVGGGTENWRLAGHTGLRLRARCWGHLLSHPRVTTSPSSSLSLSGDHQDKVTVTPPRNKPFVFDPHQRLYTVLQESNADLLRELSDVTDIQEEPDLT